MIKLYMDVKSTLQASKNGPVFQHLKSLFPFVHVYRRKPYGLKRLGLPLTMPWMRQIWVLSVNEGFAHA